MTTITKRLAGTIDCTPSWGYIARVIAEALEYGTARGKQIAREEIQNMARICDEYRAIEKTDHAQLVALARRVAALRPQGNDAVFLASLVEDAKHVLGDR